MLAASGTLTGLEVLGGYPYSQEDITDKFSLVAFSAENIVVGGVGLGLIGLIGWITKQGVYAIYAAIIWLAGIFLNIFQFILTGVFTMLGILLPTELAFMSGIIYGFVMISFFYALSGIIGQRADYG